VTCRDDGCSDLLIRKDKDSDWEVLLTWDGEDSMNCGPICFSKDGNYIYLWDPRHVNASRLVRLEIATGREEVLAEDPEYDALKPLIHPDTYEIQAVSFYKARHEWMVIDESIKDDFKFLGELDRGDFFILNRDNDDNIWIVSFTKDTGPVSYYIYDRRLKKGTFLFSEKPALNDYTLASMEPVSFISRDGLTIHGYLTCPFGKEKTKLPLVLRVHGGPWWRDVWGYASEVQLFANRGYACLQINFRGSTAYGKDFLNAGNREWGGKMHDDLVDGVKWAVERNIADPEKIAIFGSSYGGYAALTGAAFTPDLFCCAVDVFGISNLVTFIKNIPPYWNTDIGAKLIKRIGDPDREEEFLKSRSPLFHIDRIKRPLLIAQGANDVRVKQSEAEQIVEALKNKGLEYEYILFPDEGHGFVRPENRMKFYSVAEKFLAKHLGGRFEE
jgi:dipeptidyl aminopeptidase/acylaminoacyl peptidase